MSSVPAFVVWKRLHNRNTRTMMTTQRRAVLMVEFNLPPVGLLYAGRAAFVPNDLRRSEILAETFQGNPEPSSQNPEPRTRRIQGLLSGLWVLGFGFWVTRSRYKEGLRDGRDAPARSRRKCPPR